MTNTDEMDTEDGISDEIANFGRLHTQHQLAERNSKSFLQQSNKNLASDTHNVIDSAALLAMAALEAIFHHG